MERTQAHALIVALAVVVFSAIVVACTSTPTLPALTPAPTIKSSPTGQPDPTDEAGVTDGVITSAAQGAATAVVGRTPVPTPAPGAIDKGIAKVTQATGMTGKSFLGLPAAGWIQIAVTVGVILIGYLVISLVFQLIRMRLNRSGVHRGRTFFLSISDELQWLFLSWLSRYAILQLDFLSDGLRTILNDLFFTLILLLITVIVVRLIDAVVRDYRNRLSVSDSTRMRPLLTASLRLGQLTVLILAVSLWLSHFGVGTNVLSATIILVGLILALGARGIIDDAVSGFIILADQPFRVGDAIYIRDLDRKGDVLEIGTRSTRILTEFNRVVIVPNSKIGQSEVLNYSFPDPSYRLETEVSVPYDADMDLAHQVLTDTVRGVGGVMSDKSVDVLFLKYGHYARLFAVRWWISNYKEEWVMLDKVNRAINAALNDAGIEIPFPKYDLNVLSQNQDDAKAAPASPDKPHHSSTSSSQ